MNYIDHIIERVQQTEIVQSPFPHMLIEHAFDADTYGKIQDRFFEPEEMDPSPLTNLNRRLFRLDQYPEWSESTDPRKRFWAELSTELSSGEFCTAIFQKFAALRLLNPCVRDHEEKGRTDHIFLTKNVLVRDGESYTHDPHADSFDKFVTILFYLPKTPDTGVSGTSMFVPKDPNKYFDTQVHHPFDEFNFIKEMPFKPNTAFVFLKTENSYHGVLPSKHQDAHRDLLIYNLHILDELALAKLKKQLERRTN